MNPDALRTTLTTQFTALALDTPFHTPDQRRSRRFTLHEFNADALTIQTQRGADVRVPIEAFVRTLIHLHEISASEASPCWVGSSNRDPLVGGLCAVARGANGRTRVINYVLPILERLGWVLVDGRRWPNTAWLNPSFAQLTSGEQQP
ncbi:hypothetical protein D9M70_411480 [compost metagenome]